LIPFPSKQYGLGLGTFVALCRQHSESDGEVIVENLANLASLVSTGGNKHLEAMGLDIFSIVAMGLILILLAARIVRRKPGRFFRSSRARGTLARKRASGRLFERQCRSAL